MADTSLKNSKCMYKQQQKGINKQFSHNSWKYKCISENTAFPCAGINMPMMTNGYNNNILTNNAPDIESLLFGIGSSNLVKPKDKVTPQYNCIDNIKFFNTMETIIPEPMIIERSQRPNGPFC